MNDDSQTMQTAQDVAAQALGKANDQDEVAQSNEVAETLGFLQNVIERNANELMRVKNELKQKREGLRSVFDNDAQLAEAETQVQQFSAQLKERKSQIVNSPQAVSLKNGIAELNEEKKEIEATLSGHLLNYYALTNSTSFDTSDGDQWEFNIKAAVKPRKAESGE